MKNLVSVYTLLILFCIPVFAKAELDSTEKIIAAYIDSNETKVLQLLKQVVDINSGTMNFPDARKVWLIFQKELSHLGFDARWVDGTQFNRAGHLSAIRDNEGLHLLLIGHLDTVFAKDSHFQNYKSLPNSKASGPGITDMKGGDIIIVYAISALKEVSILDNLSIQVVMTGDEESHGTPHNIANNTLIEAAKLADTAIWFEDGDDNPKTAVISRRGASGWQLKVTGKSAHSSQIFRTDIGYGAIFEASRILNDFREALSAVPNLTFSPGAIVGGTDIELNNESSQSTAFEKNNVITRLVFVSGGIRALSPEQLSMAQIKMQEIVANNLAHTSAELQFSSGYPPMASTSANKKLLALYTQVSEDLNLGPVTAVDPRRAGAADISFAANYVDMAIDGLDLKWAQMVTQIKRQLT